MKTILKIILAILFFLCLLDMPYGYYQFVRFIALVGFAILAYLAHKEENQVEMVACISLAILFQPFVKIVLGRTGWNIVDVVVGIALIVSILVPIKGKGK
ncbi:hypothetical protein FACS1894177_09140 [Bacteroidia bacterium]|nr:hypothetical protein FACS1894177_09140 [Bacteroidia bacterium]